MFKAEPLKQDWDSHLPRYWNDNSPFKTHFLNALSITLPDCEKFFIETIVPYSKRIDDPSTVLKIKEFVKQESHHRYAHTQYNNWLKSQGLPVNKLQSKSKQVWKFISKNLNNQTKLAITICVEHITVVYASVFLQHNTILKQMHPQFEQIWRWHAVEEIEHKAVAADVWYASEGSNIHKNLVMCVVLPVYIWYVGRNTIVFLQEDKQLWKLQTWHDMFHFLFNKKHGLLRKSFIPWFDFMQHNFHPDNQDHSNLLLEYTKV